MRLLKLIGGLLIGILAGLIIGGVLSIIFTGITPSEYLAKLTSVGFMEAAGVILFGTASFLLSIFVGIFFHELGHLVCGLLSGYRFVSFRIFNLTFLRLGGRIRIKRFSIAGTGGQCLLSPPELPLEQIPTMLYNAGGVLANLLLILIGVGLLILPLSPLGVEFVVIFILTNLLLVLLNGIPMKLNGVGNDGYNMLYLRANLRSKRALITQLKSNALIQGGVRPAEMPEEWFDSSADIDPKNSLEVSIPLMRASRLVDAMRWQEAYDELDALYSRRDDIIPLLVTEIACELAFCALVTGDNDRARQLLDDKLTKYIDTYRKVMSSKLRILCAMALYLDNDRARAMEIYRSLKEKQSDYLLQGEVRSDLAIMETMLGLSQQA